MTENEKLFQGEFYNAKDPELRRQSNHAKALIKKYNQLPAEDELGRSEVLKELFAACGKDVRVNQPFIVDYGCHISVGENVIINMNCTFLDTGEITIGDRILIGPDVKIYTATHPMSARERFISNNLGDMEIRTKAVPVKIGDDVWIGGGAIILPGVSIGNDVVIGAGSVVISDIPDHAIACGNPCTVKKYSTDGEEKQK